MKALVIGYGSIGRRHISVLSELESIDRIDIVTKQVIADKNTYKSLDEVEYLSQYDYFIIASETFKHHEQLRYLNERISNKKILVEKPLSNGVCVDFKLNNQVYVAYNLRFHPIIQKLKILLENRKILLANIICGQYLPQWRPHADYRQSYSADLAQGGGVLRDLSHEIDYSIWLFGSFKQCHGLNRKASSLEINADDIFACVGITEKNTTVSISLDYISKKPVRQIVVHCEGVSVYADLINNTLEIVDTDQHSEKINFNINRNDSYYKMHRSFLNSEFSELCSYHQAQEVVRFFDKVNFYQGSSI